MASYLKALRAGWSAASAWEIAALVFAAWGLQWAAIEPASAYLQSVRTFVDTYGVELVGSTAAVAVIIGMIRLPISTNVDFNIKTTNTHVGIEFGNILDRQSESIVIPVNNFFDSQLGLPVAASSIHGQFIQRQLGGNAMALDTAVTSALEATVGEFVQRAQGKQTRYPVGTVVPMPLPPRTAFLVAVAESDPDSCVARSSVGHLWQAMLGLWNGIRVHGNGNAVVLPLIGGGLSRLDLEPQHLLRLILLSLVVASRDGGGVTPHKITIVLHESMLTRVNLDEIKREWS